MEKNKIFKSAARKQQQIKQLEQKLKREASKVDKMTKRQLQSYIRAADKVTEYKAQRQADTLSGFKATGFREFELQKLKVESLETTPTETLRAHARKYIGRLVSPKSTIAGAREERHLKLEALRRIGINNPRSSDIGVFWDMWDELIDEGLPPYLEKSSGADINGMYSLRDTYNEWKRLPQSQRSKENLKEMAIANFTNIQRSFFGADYDKVVASAEANWLAKHPGKKLNRPLSNEELRLYSTYGV